MSVGVESKPGPDPYRLTFGDLSDYPIIAQALDNQWMPPNVAAARQTAAPWDSTEGEHDAAVAEFHRSLVNSGTLVINRAFLLNSPSLQRHYAPGADPAARSAFGSLLNRGDVVPYLYDEQEAAEEPAFAYDETVYAAWRQIAEETRPPCVRLSWDADENAVLAAKVSQYFASHVQHINRLDARQLAADLAIPTEQAEAMRRGPLRDIATWAAGEDDTANITRNALYEEFFTRQGARPHQRLLRTGEHIVQAKQLVDLIYNTGIPTLGGIAAYTPPQSPPRSALQELRPYEGRDQDPEHLGNLLIAFRGIVADTLQRGLDGPNSFDYLSLADIARLRREEEWRAYIDSLNDLVNEGFAGGRIPDVEEFAERTRTVARRHATMLRTARRIMSSSYATRREIAVELALLVPGMGVSVVSEDHLLVAGGAITATAAPLVMRLVIRDRFSPARRNLAHSITFPALRLRNAKKDMDDIIRVFRAQHGEIHNGEQSGRGQADQQASDD